MRFVLKHRARLFTFPERLVEKIFTLLLRFMEHALRMRALQSFGKVQPLFVNPMAIGKVLVAFNVNATQAMFHR